MAYEPNSVKKARADREKQLKLRHKYDNRITVAKFGKESLDAGDYGNALKKFLEYFNIMVESKGVTDLYDLRLTHFDPKRDITELLMISHIYFEMSRIYDASPRFQMDCERCLTQFVHFSANQPYQVVNSELVRKSIKKTKFQNQALFAAAYQQILVESKKCYVVTFCFGEAHPLTAEFRIFKDQLLESPFGRTLVETYYRVSSVAVERWQDSRPMRWTAAYFIKPALVLFSKTILRLILK
jgi:hypothetical protein